LTENLSPLCELKQIELNLKVEDLVLYNVSKAIYIGLLYNELIINSIKHAFNDENKAAKITAEVVMKNDKIIVIYKDNGKGLKANVKPKLIDMMCRQLKGTYKIDYQDGFEFKVEL
jgi:two-component sensor histidine kinase